MAEIAPPLFKTFNRLEGLFSSGNFTVCLPSLSTLVFPV